MRFLLLTLASAIFALSSFAQSNNALIAHWNFNGNANDVSGNGHHGTAIGTANAVGYNGLPNTALSFNGTSDYIDVPDEPAFAIDSVTICAFFKPLGFYTANCQVNAILTRGIEHTSSFYRLGFTDTDWVCATYTPYTTFHFGGTPNPIPASTYSNMAPVQANTWYCLTATYANGHLDIYVDGSHVQSESYAGGFGHGASGGINIGAAIVSNPNFPYYFNGIMDDVRLYGRGCSQQEAMAYCDSMKKLPTTDSTNNEDTGHHGTFIRDISGQPEPSVDLYPNPARDHILISSQNGEMIRSVQVMNAVGQIVISQNVAADKAELSLAPLPSGAYVIRAMINDRAVLRKFVKQ